MLHFNFSTKKRRKVEPHKDIIKVLKKVQHVVCPYKRLDADSQDCSCIEMFEDNNLFVAYPPTALPEVEFASYHSPYDNYWKGLITLEGECRTRVFSIKGTTMYIGK